MIVYGPRTDDSIVTLCLNQDYIVVFECTVVDGQSLVWTGGQILDNDVIFFTNSIIQQSQRSAAIVFLTETAGNLLKSQVQVHSRDLKQIIINVNYSSLDIKCRSSVEAEDKFIIKISGKWTKRVIVFTLSLFIFSYYNHSSRLLVTCLVPNHFTHKEKRRLANIEFFEYIGDRFHNL